MKLSNCSLILVFLPTVQSFVTQSRIHFRRVSAALSLQDEFLSEAEAHMLEMPAKIWDELIKHEKDMLIQQKLQESDMKQATEEMVEKLLETALDHVQTQERVEREHARTSHDNFLRAMQEEDVLGEYLAENEKDGFDAFVEERLQAAQVAEVQAVKEEAEALHHLTELFDEEEALKVTLDELRELRKWEEMKTVDEVYHCNDEAVSKTLNEMKERKKVTEEKFLEEFRMRKEKKKQLQDTERAAEMLAEKMLETALDYVQTQDDELTGKIVEKALDFLQEQKHDLKEKILKAALELVQAQELAEEEHFNAAHSSFEKAYENEEMLEGVVSDKYKRFMPPKTFLEKRLHEEQEREDRFIKEEAEALRRLDELYAEEELIEAMLSYEECAEEEKKQRDDRMNFLNELC